MAAVTTPSVHWPTSVALPCPPSRDSDELAQVIEMVAGPILAGDGAPIEACRAVADGAPLNPGQLERLREVLDLYVQRTHFLQERTDMCWQAGDLAGVLDAAVDRTAMMPVLMHDLDVAVQAILDTP